MSLCKSPCAGFTLLTMGVASTTVLLASHTEPKTQDSAATPHFHRAAMVAGNQFQVFLLTKKPGHQFRSAFKAFFRINKYSSDFVRFHINSDEFLQNLQTVLLSQQCLLVYFIPSSSLEGVY